MWRERTDDVPAYYILIPSDPGEEFLKNALGKGRASTASWTVEAVDVQFRLSLAD